MPDSERVKRPLMFVLFFFIGVLALVLLAACTLQEKMIFFPEKLNTDYSFSFDGDWESLYFQVTGDVRLHALYFKSGEKRGLVIYHHGNAGSLASWGGLAEDFTANGYDLLIYDFRGYGKSTGKIRREADLLEDALYIYDHRPGNYSDSAIIQYGRSIGTGIAAWSAARRPASKLLLETPYYDFPSVAHDHMPFIPRFLVKYKLRTSQWLDGVSCPVFLFHGTEDAIIPYKHSTRICAEHPDAVLFTIPGGHHNDLGQSQDYKVALQSILRHGMGDG